TVADSGSFENCGTVSWNQGLCVASNVVSPKLQVTKTAPSEVLACDPIPMKIVVTNNGTGSARNVHVTDTLPAGLTDSSGKSTLDWDVGTLGAGQSREVTANLKAAKSGSYSNTATAKADGGLTGSSNTTTTVVKKPALTLSLACPDKLFIGLKGDKTLTVKNTGDGPAKDCVVEDTLPAGITFVSADNGGTAANGKVQWRLGTLEAGQSKTLKMTITSTTQGTVTNTATAMAYCADAATASCQTRFEGIPAILLEVVDENDPIRVGDNEVYTITVTNQGSATDTNIKLTCTVEAAQQLVSGGGATNGVISGSTITFAPLPKLDAKQHATFKVTVKALKAGDIRFTVALKSDQLTRSVDETEATNQYE
ncbi:MAG TPA: DUF11 domain-containing protein, partial [Pirellulaceae bacterium]|nr:DUF11 domain-containing protein [Pirellulaceae bacterium]